MRGGQTFLARARVAERERVIGERCSGRARLVYSFAGAVERRARAPAERAPDKAFRYNCRWVGAYAFKVSYVAPSDEPSSNKTFCLRLSHLHRNWMRENDGRRALLMRRPAFVKSKF